MVGIKKLGCLGVLSRKTSKNPQKDESYQEGFRTDPYDKQVQGGSVLIIEPGTLCVFQKPKSVVCEVLKEGKIKITYVLRTCPFRQIDPTTARTDSGNANAGV